MMKHLAIIMDGNRRWAKQRGFFAWQGHQQGVHNVEMVIQYCLEKNISYLSLYALSIENLKRPEIELHYLFSLIKDLKKRADEFIKNGVKVRFIGDLSLVTSDIQADLREIEQMTRLSDRLICNFLFCYGSGQEIVNAAQKYAEDGVHHTPLTITQFKKYLWMGDVPDPDLIIRTGGVQRLSNFLLLQAAYSEIYFLNCFWPDFTRFELDQIVNQAISTKKNFGI